MATISSDILEEIVDRLVRGLQPDQLYLFGSQARGGADEGSDVDLLLVVPDSDLPRHRREALSYDLLWGLTTPVDVIVLTRAEFQRGSQVRTSLPSTVQNEGKLLYGRSPNFRDPGGKNGTTQRVPVTLITPHASLRN